MVKTIESRINLHPRYFFLLIASCLLVLASLILLTYPANAAQPAASIDQQNTQTDPVCTAPPDWGQTTRLKVPDKPTKQWEFTVDQPQMMVNLEFFYYQDYSKAGCPYDCSTGECQTDETGNGETPFGSFSVLDGKEGANRGARQFGGVLTQGTYQVTFTANGNPGSINVGLHVRQEAVPTATPTNTLVPSEVTPSATPQTPEPTPITPEPEDTPTPTATSRPKRTPPATLPPPTPFPGSPPPQALIPQTGFELGETSGLLLLILVPFSIGIIGLGITFYGIAKRLK